VKHLTPGPDSQYGPICGDGKYRRMESGDSLVALGGGYNRVGDVDCQDCWAVIADIYFLMKEMGVKQRERNMLT